MVNSHNILSGVQSQQSQEDVEFLDFLSSAWARNIDNNVEENISPHRNCLNHNEEVQRRGRGRPVQRKDILQVEHIQSRDGCIFGNLANHDELEAAKTWHVERTIGLRSNDHGGVVQQLRRSQRKSKGPV